MNKNVKRTVSAEKLSRINKIINKAENGKEYAKHSRKLDKIDTSALRVAFYSEDYNNQIDGTDEFERKEISNMWATPELIDIIQKYLLSTIDSTLDLFKDAVIEDYKD